MEFKVPAQVLLFACELVAIDTKQRSSKISALYTKGVLNLLVEHSWYNIVIA